MGKNMQAYGAALPPIGDVDDAADPLTLQEHTSGEAFEPVEVVQGWLRIQRWAGDVWDDGGHTEPLFWAYVTMHACIALKVHK